MDLTRVGVLSYLSHFRWLQSFLQVVSISFFPPFPLSSFNLLLARLPLDSHSKHYMLQQRYSRNFKLFTSTFPLSFSTGLQGLPDQYSSLYRRTYDHVFRREFPGGGESGLLAQVSTSALFFSGSLHRSTYSRHMSSHSKLPRAAWVWSDGKGAFQQFAGLCEISFNFTAVHSLPFDFHHNSSSRPASSFLSDTTFSTIGFISRVHRLLVQDSVSFVTSSFIFHQRVNGRAGVVRFLLPSQVKAYEPLEVAQMRGEARARWKAGEGRRSKGEVPVSSMELFLPGVGQRECTTVLWA